MKKFRDIACPVHRTLEIIGKRWTALIIRDLVQGKMRFTELQRSLEGITPKMLCQRLRELEEWGLVTREVYPEVPVRVEYAVTAMGQDLQLVIESMADFGDKWLGCDDGARDEASALMIGGDQAL